MSNGESKQQKKEQAEARAEAERIEAEIAKLDPVIFPEGGIVRTVLKERAEQEWMKARQEEKL